MGKDGFLTPKAIANRIKAKGLQKLRWYCQVCEKQCRDENGFKNHCTSESHQRQMLLIGENVDSYMQNYSKEFLNDFVKLLSRRYNTKRIQANIVYQEYISDRHHLHMNATQWDTLTDFVKHLGREGICHVDETPKGWFITWIDRSPKALERQAATQKKERAEIDDEQREQKLLKEQIEKARREAEARGETMTEDGAGVPGAEVSELKRENEDEKIKLNLSIKSSNSGTGFGFKVPTSKPRGLAALAQPKKSTSHTPSLSSSSNAAKSSSSSSEKRKLTAMEEIILEEQQKKLRMEERNFRSSASSGGLLGKNNKNGDTKGKDNDQDRDRDHKYEDDRGKGRKK